MQKIKYLYEYCFLFQNLGNQSILSLIIGRCRNIKTNKTQFIIICTTLLLVFLFFSLPQRKNIKRKIDIRIILSTYNLLQK